MFKVAKFGGTSVADKTGFRCVAKWVQEDEDIRAIVLSAGGKTAKCKKVTDLLMDASEKIIKGESVIKSLGPFIDRVLEDAESIGLKNFIKDELMKIGQEVEKKLSLDFILSRGEYFYAKLFSLYYGLPFIDSANLIGFYQNGALNMGLSQFQIVKAYEKYGKFVCGGFYGALPNGQIKTFTRGGSDFSGAIVAKALNAQRYLNFTDVDGVFPFAPSIKQSAPIKEISFDKIRLLGEFGATVLHPASVLPLYGEGTEIIVKNTFNQSAIGTVVKERSLSEPFAVGVKENCSYAKLIKRGCGYELHSRFSNCNKIICSVASLDFEEICFEGEFSEEFIQSMGLEFCQLQTGVAIFYLTLCDKTKEIISLLQKQRATVFVSIFESGAYLAVKSENVNKVKEIVYNV